MHRVGGHTYFNGAIMHNLYTCIDDLAYFGRADNYMASTYTAGLTHLQENVNVMSVDFMILYQRNRRKKLKLEARLQKSIKRQKINSKIPGTTL